ncbi:MAG: hypothetical protein REI64_16740 [Pedobacter sp.]|uniref:hypothetical protein n=1 Tax=Pedobacter sp. TaxID=1411316 RepID=UPI002806F996|nr:hypothetical protein [Pedobacter sp.]MDQ8006453.1 hypothetical protein [Pedobacter sp.]
MKRLQTLCTVAIILTLQSCKTPSYFLPAVTGNDISYLPKPMEVDSVKSKTYLSGSIAGLTLPYNSGNLDMGFLNVSRGQTFKHLNFAYGAYGFAGRTSDTHTNRGERQIAEFDNKNFYGGGLRTSLGFYDISGNAEFRLLSWENSLSFENGSYASFRKKYSTMNNPDVVSASKTVMYTTGAATEIIWHSKHRPVNQFAFRIFYGFTADLNSNLRQSNPTEEINGKAIDVAFFVKLNKFYGILNAGGNKGTSGKLSLGYAF